ncbi:hypothetical protein ABZ319_30435 [Nocardia sp. NPDC005978]|uniref:hypothetical protein n=1 Tax=Nocardia sp. NPDC005978 TaxID=3156725 RepID=UPI0033BC431F
MKSYGTRIVQSAFAIGVVLAAAACEPDTGSGPTVVSTPPDSTPSACAAATIVKDLKIDEWQRDAEATVTDCNGEWAFISWDSPGDNARIVYRAASKWADYVRFPHDRCWSEASAAGAPATLQKYFQSC